LVPPEGDDVRLCRERRSWHPPVCGSLSKPYPRANRLGCCGSASSLAGWRFFAHRNKPANIRLEPSVTIKSSDLDALGDNFEKTSKGFIDFLLLDAKGFPLIVLEAKREDKNPLVGKEQARKYAKSQNCRFVILSNGNLHYFWDLERGNPYVITSFPTPDSVVG
jgi:type I restriction enzyme, R subunit